MSFSSTDELGLLYFIWETCSITINCDTICDEVVSLLNKNVA